MDKYEYKVKLEQIEKLADKKDYVTAASIADGIDWRKIKSISTLNMIADIYDEAGRLEDCYELLNMVYDRSTVGRRVLYRMTEIAVKMKDFEEAIELYKEFVKVAPHDIGKYLLKYQIYRERGSSVEDQIIILEEYKTHEYDEQWAYELACLYEEAGRIDQCVEECDELILWFSEGEYVIKAMELKMKYEELTASQQEKYERRFEGMEPEEEEAVPEEYLAACYEGETATDSLPAEEREESEEEPVEELAAETAAESAQETELEEALEVSKEIALEEIPQTLDVEEEDDTPQVSVVNVHKFSTINLQEELAKGLQELFEQEGNDFSDTETSEEIDENISNTEEFLVEGAITQEFVPLKENIGVIRLETEVPVETKDSEDDIQLTEEAKVVEEHVEMEVEAEYIEIEDAAIVQEETVETKQEETAAELFEEEKSKKVLSETGEIQSELLKYVAVPQKHSIEEYLSTDEDGQMSLAIGKENTLEKQITGQMTIEEILEAWEEKKRQAREKMKESGEKKPAVLCETGEITGLLEDFIPRTPKEVQELIDEIESGTFTEEMAEEFAEEITEEPAEECAEGTAEVPVTPVFEEEPEPVEEEISENEFEDDLPQDIDLQEMLEEAVADCIQNTDVENSAAEIETTVKEEHEAEGVAEETSEEDESEPSDYKEPIGQNTASMLDAIERALALEIDPLETSGKYLTEEQEKIFAYFTSVGGMRKQLVNLLAEEKKSVDKTDSQKGNLLITGHPGNGKTTLAIHIVKALQKQRGVKGAKIAKVSGAGFNKKNPEEVFTKLGGGALIIERAGSMNDDTVQKLSLAMEGFTNGLLVILEDSADEINLLMSKNEIFAQKFDRNVNIPIFSNDELVAFGKSYAEEQEFYFEEMAVLALYDCIGVRQTSEHVVNVTEVKEIIDEAIACARKKSKGLFARLSKKRVDEFGNQLLLEEDFDF